jgi:anti-sigma factor RsiW
MTKRPTKIESEVALSDEDVLELLPWYAGGKTTAAETAAIERKLSSNPRLQAELALVRQEKQVSVASVKALGEPNPDLLNKMLGQLDSVRQLPPIVRDDAEAASGFLARLFGFAATPALRFALVAACLVIVAESAALLKLTGAQDQPYETASAPVAFVIGLMQGADVNAAMTALRGHADLVAGVEQGS